MEMAKQQPPDPRNWIIKENIDALIATRGKVSTHELARLTNGTVSQSMIAQFMKRPEEFHLSARVFREIAEALGAELWMLFIPKFPFGAMGQGKPVKQITGEGYRLLKVFEGLPDDKRKAILDYTLFQIAETEPVQARQIREARAQYKAAPLPAGSPYPYKKCSEDFD